MSSLGSPGTPTPPPALRVARPGWRDPRLWIGVVLVAASVVTGARLLAGADDAARVWAVARQQGAGAQLRAADVVVRRVRFGDAGDLDLYYPADAPLPDGLVLDRTVGAGELLARSATTPAGAAEVVRVSVEVDPGRVDPSVHAGSVVDVYLHGPVLSGVTVLAAPAYDRTYAVSGTRQLVLAVPSAGVARFERARASMQDAALYVDVR